MDLKSLKAVPYVRIKQEWDGPVEWESSQVAIKNAKRMGWPIVFYTRMVLDKRPKPPSKRRTPPEQPHHTP